MIHYEQMIRAAIVVTSDTRTKDSDVSGAALVELLKADGAEIVSFEIVSDDQAKIEGLLIALSDRSDVNLIISTGGTGLSPRDNTPEATRAVIEREVPGIAEALRSQSLKFTKMAMLSRGVCGVRNRTLIVNLPGSQKGVRQSYDILRPVLSHAIDLIEGRSSH